jgi:Tol biopolymer transport system component
MQEDIFVVRTNGTGRRQLTNDFHKDRCPRWSPDGERIAFYSNRSGSNEIWTINPDGSGLQQLTETSGHAINYPVWSPDGLRIAYFNRADGKNTYIFHLTDPWTEQTPEVLPPLSETGEFFVAWSWSPDSKWLAGYEGPDDGITIYNLESHQYRRLTHSGRRPVWLRDSRRLLFLDSGNVFLLDIDSGRVHELLSISPDIVGELSISHDNRWIYFHGESSEADIWMLTLNEEQK